MSKRRTAFGEHRIRLRMKNGRAAPVRHCSCIDDIIGADRGCYNEILRMNDDDDAFI